MSYMNNVATIADEIRPHGWIMAAEIARTLDRRRQERDNYGEAEATVAIAALRVLREHFTHATADLTTADRISYLRTAPNAQPDPVMRVMHDAIMGPIDEVHFQACDDALASWEASHGDDGEGWCAYLADAYAYATGADETTARPDLAAHVAAMLEADAANVAR